MKAIWITRNGGPEVLELRDTPMPVPGAGEVLIAVKAAGLNRSDVLSRTSKSYGNDGAEIPGLEVSGTIVEVPATTSRWKLGDQVCALVTGGGYAEFVAVPAGQCLPIPGGWSLEEAATLPETVFTVWLNAFQIGRLQPGKHFLVHGGSNMQLKTVKDRFTRKTINVRYDPANPSVSLIDALLADDLVGFRPSQNPFWLRQAPVPSIEETIKLS